VDAFVSFTDTWASVIIISALVGAALLGGEDEDRARWTEASSDVTPVLGLLWCFWCWSLSEGERDRLRVESAASGMTDFSQCFQILSVLVGGMRWERGLDRDRILW
jgi:hypothetical protein